MKLSVFTVATPDLQPEELAKAAADAGIEGIEWRFKEIPEEAAGEKPSFWRHNRCSMDPNGTQEDWLEFQQAADKHGRRSLAVVPYLTCGDVEATEKVMQAAKLIGASFIRAGIPGYDRKRNYNELYTRRFVISMRCRILLRLTGSKPWWKRIILRSPRAPD